MDTATQPSVKNASPPPNAAGGPQEPVQAVFLHAGWRSGGTWLWSLLRALDGVEGYYEPLHEQMASLTPRRIAQLSAKSWHSGHGQTSPYYLEYAALLRLKMLGTASGVRHYHPRFATERFFLGPSDADPELKGYIGSLLAAAAYIERLPVLKFARSLGRVGWMAERFPDALHAVVLRNPAAQWQSSRAQLRLTRNRYFLVAPCLVLARNREDMDVAAALRCFGVALPDLPDATRKLDAELCWRHLLRQDAPAQERMFLAYWLVTAAASLRCKPVLPIDLERIAQSASYRSRLEAVFEGHGLPVSLDSDGRPPSRPPVLDARNHRMALEWLDDAAGLDTDRTALLAAKLGPSPPQAAAERRHKQPTQQLANPARRSAWSGPYFAFIALTMPLRRLHGYLRRSWTQQRVR